MTRIKLHSKRITDADFIKAKTEILCAGATIFSETTVPFPGGGISVFLEVDGDRAAIKEITFNAYLFEGGLTVLQPTQSN
jgi:hypothetical protein